mmetsp:Transcript_95/g.168  ORF Transcript_95/g.168 Transcript_95/m.168 type:complete len:245 (+) Transcript_95:605-1339(+)
MFIVSTIVTIARNERRWNSIKYAATFVGTFPAGYMVVGSLVKLKILLVNAQASMKKLQQKTEEILEKKTKSRALMSKPGSFRETTEIDDSKTEREIQIKLNQVSDSNVKTKSRVGEVGSCGDQCNPILPAKYSRKGTPKQHSFTGSNQASRALERSKLAECTRDRIIQRTTKKLDRLISVGLLVVLATLAFSVSAFIATATSNETYSKFADEQSQNYSVLSDIGSYVISIGILSYGIWYMATTR